jgi:hypothetical protein
MNSAVVAERTITNADIHSADSQASFRCSHDLTTLDEDPRPSATL